MTRAHVLAGDPDHALELAQGAVAIAAATRSPIKRAEAVLERGAARLAAGRADDALADTSSAAATLSQSLDRRDRRVTRAHALYANALARTGRHAEAEKEIERALGGLPVRGFDEVAYRRGVVLRLAGRHAKAIEALKIAAASLERTPAARYWRPLVSTELDAARRSRVR
jgi:tetratricopeptide (TPR) repeat protein